MIDQDAENQQPAGSSRNAEVAQQLADVLERQRVDELSAEVAEIAQETGADRLLEGLDPGTQKHSQRASEAAAIFATRAGWTPERARTLSFGMLVHDVGKARQEIKELVTSDEGFVGESGAAKKAIINEHPIYSGVYISQCLEEYIASMETGQKTNSVLNVSLLESAQWLGENHHKKMGIGELSPQDDQNLMIVECIDTMDAMLDSEHRRYLKDRAAKEGSSKLSPLVKAMVEVMRQPNEEFPAAMERLLDEQSQIDQTAVEKFEAERLGGVGRFQEVYEAVMEARRRSDEESTVAE